MGELVKQVIRITLLTSVQEPVCPLREVQYMDGCMSL